MNHNTKNRIKQNLSDIKTKTDKLQYEIDEDLQISILEMIDAVEKWLENDTERNSDKFANTTFSCGIALSQKIGRKYRELNDLILKIRCNLIIYETKEIFKFIKEFLDKRRLKKITEFSEELNSIILKKESKNIYNWEIKVNGDSLSQIIDKINVANNELKELYSELKRE